MSHQIKPSVTNPTIADIFQKISDQKLDFSTIFSKTFCMDSRASGTIYRYNIKGFPFS